MTLLLAKTEQAQLLEKAHDAILVRDLQGKILFWNKGAERLYGWTCRKAIGRNVGPLLCANQKKFMARPNLMPVMDGVATIYALMRINPRIKIVVASGLNVNGGRTKASEAGIRHFLVKPYSARALIKTLRAILDEP